MSDKIGGWKEWLPVIQDARFLQDASLCGGARSCIRPGVGARYRIHLGASLSRRSDAAFVSDVFRNTCDLQASLEARGGMNGEERRALAQIYVTTVARSLFFHDRVAFRDCMARLYEVEPGFSAKWPKVASLGCENVWFQSGRRAAFIVDQIAVALQAGVLKIVLAHPGVGPFVQQTARALLEADLLASYWTMFADQPKARWRRTLVQLASRLG